MSEEITIKLRRRRGLLLVYRPLGRPVPMPDFSDLEEICEVRELNRLSHAMVEAEGQNRVAIVTADIFGRRATALNALRERASHFQILFLDTDGSSAWKLLQSGIADQVLPTAPGASEERRSIITAAMRSSGIINSLQQNNQQLTRESVTDSLTGLYNQSHALEMLDREFKRAERSHDVLSCVMIDLDLFRDLNESFGHRFGNYVLHELSYMLRLSIRQSDIAGRYGGEEFLLILPATDGPGAAKLCEKLRRTIEIHTFRFDNCQASITASFGFSCSRDPGILSTDHMLQALVRSVAVAKDSGRNRICGLIPDMSLVKELNLGNRTMSISKEAPVLLLLTRHETLRKTVDHAAELDGYQLISFEEDRDFLAEFGGFNPTALIVDCTFSGYGRNFLRQVILTARELSLPILLVVNGHFCEGDPETCEFADDLISETFSMAEVSQKLQRLMKTISIEKQLENAQAELKLAQKRMIANERMRTMGEMMGGFSSQFSTVMSNVTGPAQLLLDQKMVSDDAVDIVKGICRTAQEGSQIVQQLQKYLRPRAAAEARLLSASDVVNDALQLTRPMWHHDALATGRTYYVANHIADDALVFAEPNDLKEVLVGIITNAIEAMPKGGALTFSSQIINDQVQISIVDNGRGMPPETLEKAFDPLFTTKDRRGAGLGLQVAWALMRRYKGRITLESEVKKGTTVRLYFPKPGTEDSTAVLRKNLEITRIPKRSLRILFADEEKIIRDVYALLLEKLGHTVELAGTLEEVRSLAIQTAYDLAFVDLAFRGASGWEAARIIRESLPATHIVLMSGWSDDYPEHLLQDHGIATVLHKPVKHADLQQLIEQLCAAPEAEPEAEGESFPTGDKAESQELK